MTTKKENIARLFPESSNPGNDITNINSSLMVILAEGSSPISSKEWQEILEDHQQFLETGGSGGNWETYLTDGGLVFGVYLGATGKEGEQAHLEHKNLEGQNLRNLQLPYANLLGVLCKNQDLSGANLSYCLLTDSVFDNTNFEGANLDGADFSRSSLRNCNFRKAILKKVDFENCDLSGSDFTGASLEGSRFPGAKLENVKV